MRFVVGALLFSASFASADISFSYSKDWIRSVHFECNGSSECEALCGNASKCTFKESTCRSCAGTADRVLYGVFSGSLPLNDNCSTDSLVSDLNEVKALLENHFVILDATSAYNFTTAWNAKMLLPLVASINSTTHKIEKIEYGICITPKGVRFNKQQIGIKDHPTKEDE